MADKSEEGSKAYSMLPAKPVLIASAICILIGICQAWPDGPVKEATKVPAAPAPSAPVAKPNPPCEEVKPEAPVVSPPDHPYVDHRELDEVKWTDWVKIPVGYTWRINRPGCWEEYWFWDGRKLRFEAGETAWLGDNTNCNFRLRGTKGPVDIIIEPRK